jgi:ankyrin repeat protein
MKTKPIHLILLVVVLGIIAPLAFVFLKPEEQAVSGEATLNVNQFPRTWQLMAPPVVRANEFRTVPLTKAELSRIYYWGISSAYYNFDRSTGFPKTRMAKFFLSNETPYLITDVKVRMKYTYPGSPNLRFSKDFVMGTKLSSEHCLTHGVIPPGHSSHEIPLWLDITPEAWRRDTVTEFEFLSANRVMPGPSLESAVSMQGFIFSTSDDAILKKFRAKPELLKVKDSRGTGVIHFAIMANRVELVDSLVKLGVDINEKVISGNNAMHFAAVTSPEMIKKVASYNVDPNATNMFSASPLDIALRMKKKAHFKPLIDAGANIEGINADGATVLLVGCGLRFLDEVLELKKLGAKTQVADRHGRDAYHQLIEWGSVDEFEVLLKNNIGDLNRVTSIGQNLAHRAAWRQRIEVLQFLYENKVDMTLRDNMTRLPVDLAIERGANNSSGQQTIEFFARLGIKPSAQSIK